MASVKAFSAHTGLFEFPFMLECKERVKRKGGAELWQA